MPPLYDKIVVRRRGGFCYELNGLFCELLTALGFRVQMLSARVRRDDGGFGPEFDHMLLKVELDDPWLVDVGFGDSLRRSDRLSRRRSRSGQWTSLSSSCRGRGVAAAARRRERARSRCTPFAMSPTLSDYQEMCTFHQTSPESHFTKSWICSRATPDGRITLANMRLIVTRMASREENAQRRGEVRRCLRETWE